MIRDVYGLLMRRIAQVTQASVAKDLGISTSQMSRIVAAETGITIDKIPEFLDALGLRLLEVDGPNKQVVTIPENHYMALVTMADIGVDALKSRMKEGG